MSTPAVVQMDFAAAVVEVQRVQVLTDAAVCAV